MADYEEDDPSGMWALAMMVACDVATLVAVIAGLVALHILLRG